MGFPYHDANWNEVVDYLQPHLTSTDRVLAPDAFWWRWPCPVQRWVTENLRTNTTYDWVVVHKGELDQFPRGFLEHLARTMRPAFANPVFVVWTVKRVGANVDPQSSDLIAYFDTVGTLPAVPTVDNSYERDLVFADTPVLARFGDMSDSELRAEENAFFRTGGYRYKTARDRGYYEDLQRQLAKALDRWQGGRVLDLACGGLRLLPLPPSTWVVRVDFAEEGVRRALAADGRNPSIQHATADAHHLAFPDGCFDSVAFVDSIEHVRDAEAVLREVGRVLRTGGELLLTYANRNSMNQVITRKLGYPEFMTNHQHIREFVAEEMAGLLEALGFEIVETGGVGLLPFWGVPGLDKVVRTLTDDDPEVVQMMRTIGARAGPDYAYVGVALARKQ